MKRRIITALLCAGFVVFMAMNTAVAQDDNYVANVSSQQLTPGEEFNVTLSFSKLSETVNIRGIQVDISNIDTENIEILSVEEKIVDSTAFTNEVVYFETAQPSIRLLYAKRDGVIQSRNHDAILRINGKIKDEVLLGGTVVLPITIKTVTATMNFTQTLQVSIEYQGRQIHEYSISWGDMNFTYHSGEWNPATHEYSIGTWQAENNQIVVSNGGENAAFTVEYRYVSENDAQSIQGNFHDKFGIDIQKQSVKPGENQTVTLNISGKPDSGFENKKIGTITMTIQEGE